MTDNVEKIAREFSAKRTRAILEAKERRNRVYQQCPALQELDAEMAKLSLNRFKENTDEAVYQSNMKQLIDRKGELLRQMNVSNLEPVFECTVCNDTGKTEAGLCKCFMRRVIEENLASANLSVGAEHERFENFDLGFYSQTVDPKYGVSPYEHMKQVLNVCKEFSETLDENGQSLLLVGAPGLGKTFLSSAIAHKALESGHTVVYLSAGEFCARASQNKFAEASPETDSYYSADLLIIDDLGTEFKTSLTVSLLSDVIDRRLRQGKKMIFSTNLKLDELQRFYNERIGSRLMGGFKFLQCIGKDIRVQKRG